MAGYKQQFCWFSIKYNHICNYIVALYSDSGLYGNNQEWNYMYVCPKYSLFLLQMYILNGYVKNVLIVSFIHCSGLPILA